MPPKPNPITKIPEPILREETGFIDFEEYPLEKLAEIADMMTAAMRKANGIGIAAPQVGLSLRMTVIDSRPKPLVLINPVITRYSFRKEDGEEGCLSVPGHFDGLRRAREVEIEAYDLSGEKIKFVAKGFFARVCQHEIDHLNGILFIDRIKSKKLTGPIT